MYDNNTIRRVEQILGYQFTGTQLATEEREYTVVDGVIYVDLFEGNPAVEGFTEFKKAFNGRVNGINYFNEIILLRNCKGTVKVTANWGSNQFMTDIDGLLSWVDDNDATIALDNAGVSSKKIEDFSVSFRDASEAQKDLNVILHDSYGFYIRKPFILDVAKEQRDAGRYF